MKKSTTKRALLLSLLAVVLSVSMLVGTTFAWFTDSVSSDVNKIIAGNLDVELYYQVEGQSDWTKVTSTTNVFKENALWEPGHTEVVKLKVVNEGSLALKYNLGVNVASETGSVNVNGEEFLLSDYIKFAVIDGANTYTRDEAIAAAEANGASALANAFNSGMVSLAEGAETVVTMVVYMPSEVGNNANHAKGEAVPTINLGISLFATQATAEKDSFDEYYDAGAPWIGDADTDWYDAAAAEYVIRTPEELAGLAQLVNNGNSFVNKTIKLGGDIDLNDMAWTPIGSDLSRCFSGTFDGNGYTVYNLNVEVVNNAGLIGYAANGGNVKNLTVKNATVKANDYAGVIMGRGYTDIDNCRVENATVITTPYIQNGVYDGGAKAGGVIGQIMEGAGNTVTNCSVNNVTVYGFRDIGGVVGMVHNNNSCSGNTASNVVIGYVICEAITADRNENAGAIYGRVQASATVSPAKDSAENQAFTWAAPMYIVADTYALQNAFDNAVAGTTIQLQSGVNYGTLYLRPFAGGAATNDVDWIGNNYGWETYTLFEDITILGADGATVDAIEIEGGTYYHTEHSQDDTYPVMLSLVELKNVVIDGVTFTGKGGYDPQGYGNAINLSGNNIKVDGLTLKNCVLNNAENNARLIYKTESTTHVHNYAYDGVTYTFSPTLKNITVTGCFFNGGYMGIELRETENLTITNNTFNVADRNILLPINTGCTYTGNITITGNVSNNAQERFVRADGMGDAVVVIKDNTLNNYMGEDTDYIKVTNANNVTIENNTLN